MLIPPPTDDNYESEIIEFGWTPELKEKVKNFFAIEKWICSSCGLTNFGYNEKCADFKCRRPK